MGFEALLCGCMNPPGVMLLLRVCNEKSNRMIEEVFFSYSL